MSTFGTMKARIASEMKRGELSASATAVQSSVLSAIAHLERRRFPWNEFVDSTATASSSVAYVPFSQLAVTPVIIDSISMSVNGREYSLLRKTWQEIDDIDAAQWYGYPDFYAIHSESIRLYPAPSTNQTMLISGVKQLTEVSAGATANASNAWMTDGEELVRLTAKSMLFRDELRSPEQAMYFRSEAERVYRELMRENAALVGSGRVRGRFF